MWYGHFDCRDDRAWKSGKGDFRFGDFGFRWEGHKRRGRWGGRMFEQGDLKIVILQLLAEKPRHGYEIIKALEERSGGVYAPSAGAVYPTLTLLEEMGHAVSSEEGGKKVYTITEAGRAYLDENRTTVDDVFERLSDIGSAVFSDSMKEVGKAFGRIMRSTFMASSDHLKDSTTSKRILEVLDRAAKEIDEILKEPHRPAEKL